MTKPSRAEYAKEWRKRNPTYHRDWARANMHRRRQYNLITRYGLTEDLYNKIAEEQDHCCKICGRPAQLEWHGKLHVDHIKGTKVVRGLLCSGCNRGLGLFRESTAALSAAIEYLRCQPL